MKVLITIITLLLAGAICYVAATSQPPSANNNLKVQVDSLKQEIFVMELQLQRYEYIMDRIDEEMSDSCKKELDKIFNETE